MAQYRKEQLVNGHFYHIFSRSIAKFVVFNNVEEFDRFYQLINLYRHTSFNFRYSQYLRIDKRNRRDIAESIASQHDYLVEIIAYCFMPTHIHMILKQVKDKGITKFVGRVLNGYSRYFNTKHKRIGPLWSGRFKSVLVDQDEQLLHLTRYLHLNPTSAGLTNDVKEWHYSSYGEYVNRDDNVSLSNFEHVIDMDEKEYEKFVEDHKSYQREISIIKNITIDNYSG